MPAASSSRERLPALAALGGPIFFATAAFIVATLIALAVSYALTRRLPLMPFVTAIVVVVFGGLTLWLQDETFIKMKPTIINVLFGGVLLGGLAFGKSLLGYVFDAVFKLTDEGWRKLTFRWGLFFFVLAVLNEIVWRIGLDRHLGQLQGVRHPAAHLRLRPDPDAADQPLRAAERERRRSERGRRPSRRDRLA